MTSRKVTPTAVNVKVKKILTTFSCPLACVGTNLAAICPMGVRLPSEKLVLPYFSSPRGVATLDCDSHSQAGSTIEEVEIVSQRMDIQELHSRCRGEEICLPLGVDKLACLTIS